MDVGASGKELTKVRPDCLLALGEDGASIVLHHCVRAKAANHTVHVPGVKRVDEFLHDLGRVHERILLTPSGCAHGTASRKASLWQSAPSAPSPMRSACSSNARSRRAPPRPVPSPVLA